jgi:isopentenyl-diphosphate delta-isomerase
MTSKKTVQRKKEHIELCLTDNVVFKTKTNGFENYEFEHYAITEIEFEKLDLTTKFFGKKISLPFLISSMTGGTFEAERINEKLAIVANILNIPIGVGSQRQALEDNTHHSTYKVVRKNAGSVPILGNIGASQVIKSKDLVGDFERLIDLIEANALIIHVNILQELLQPEGEPNFKGLLKKLGKAIPRLKTPIVVKEVGSGISKKAAKRLLEIGVKGIDVAGSGGTSWAAVELLRNHRENKYLSEWGLPTSYCIRTVKELKRDYDFTLIGSGGIMNGVDTAKALALGSDITASARIILQEVTKNEVESVIKLINNWFLTVKQIMLLTGCDNMKKFKAGVLKRNEEFI